MLRAELGAVLGAERFLSRDARSRRELDHPHILTLIDSGDGGRLPLLRAAVRPRRVAARAARAREAARHRRGAVDHEAGRERARLRAPPRRRPPRHQAGEHPLPRGRGDARRLRHRAGREGGRRQPADRDRPLARHAAVHEPRAGDGRSRARRAERRLLARRGAVRDAGGRAAGHRRDGAGDDRQAAHRAADVGARGTRHGARRDRRRGHEGTRQSAGGGGDGRCRASRAALELRRGGGHRRHRGRRLDLVGRFPAGARTRRTHRPQTDHLQRPRAQSVDLARRDAARLCRDELRFQGLQVRDRPAGRWRHSDATPRRRRDRALRRTVESGSAEHRVRGIDQRGIRTVSHLRARRNAPSCQSVRRDLLGQRLAGLHQSGASESRLLDLFRRSRRGGARQHANCRHRSFAAGLSPPCPVRSGSLLDSRTTSTACGSRAIGPGASIIGSSPHSFRT